MRHTRNGILQDLDQLAVLVVDKDIHLRQFGIHHQVLEIEGRPLLTHRIRSVEHIGKARIQIVGNFDIHGLDLNIVKHVHGADAEHISTRRILFRGKVHAQLGTLGILFQVRPRMERILHPDHFERNTLVGLFPEIKCGRILDNHLQASGSLQLDSLAIGKGSHIVSQVAGLNLDCRRNRIMQFRGKL